MMSRYVLLFLFAVCSLNAFAKTDNDKYIEILKQIPKTDLHAHFTATVPEKMLPAKPQRDEFKNLNDFTLYYDEFYKDLKYSQEFIESATYEICMEYARHNVHYVEIRKKYPSSRSRLSVAKNIDAIYKGFRKAKNELNKKGYFFDMKLIVAFLKREHTEEQEKVIDDIENILKKSKYRNFIVGIDFLGNECGYNFDNIFINKAIYVAKKNGLKFTFHAGEDNSGRCDSLHYMRWAVFNWADRIGHGIKVLDDAVVLEQVRNNKIGIELCPTSNVKIKNVDSYKSLPVKQMLDKNVLVSINTDDAIILKTDITNEFVQLYKNGVITRWDDIKKLAINGLKIGFMDEEERERLIEMYKQEFKGIEQKYYKEIKTFF